MSKAKALSNEPSVIDPGSENYNISLMKALNWYNSEKDKKQGHAFLRNYIISNRGRDPLKVYDRIPFTKIISTYMWLGELWNKGSRFQDKHQKMLDQYVDELLQTEVVPVKVEEKPVVNRPSIQDLMKEKAQEVLGEIEGEFDKVVFSGEDIDLYKFLKARAIPANYCQYIESWINEKLQEFVSVYESQDDQIKEGYSNLTKRRLTKVIQVLGEWKKELENYTGFKKANRKPRAKKEKSPVQQIAKLSYKKEDPELSIKSINPTEIVGASQVWVYNTKYKKLAVYRSDSARGIQVKGTTLQNYDPDLCEQKTLRKPDITIKQVLEGSKIQLRKIMSALSTKDSKANGRINDECILLRAIK